MIEEGSAEDKPLTKWQQHRFLVMIGAVVLTALFLVGVALALYASSGAAQLDLSRPGYVSVRDHGPGVAAEDQPHLFDRFYRAADARSKPGSGLGLAIVDQIVRSHGGTVSVANAPDGGAVFTIVFAPTI